MTSLSTNFGVSLHPCSYRTTPVPQSLGERYYATPDTIYSSASQHERSLCLMAFKPPYQPGCPGEYPYQTPHRSDRTRGSDPSDVSAMYDETADGATGEAGRVYPEGGYCIAFPVCRRPTVLIRGPAELVLISRKLYRAPYVMERRQASHLAALG